MRAYVRFTTILGVAFAAAAMTVADVPRLISFQGKLAGQGAGPVNLDVTIYDAEVGGNVLFAESHYDVPLTNGVFSIEIGSQTAGGVPDSALGSSPLWLGLSVDGGAELAPRTRLVTVPFAVKAAAAERLVRPDTLDTVAQTQAGTGLAFESGTWPLITAGHNNAAGYETRMWIGHSETFPYWGIQYRDLYSGGYGADTLEFVAGDPNVPRFGFHLSSSTMNIYDGSGSSTANRVRLNANTGGALIYLNNPDGQVGLLANGHDSLGGGSLWLYDGSGSLTNNIRLVSSATYGSRLAIYNNNAQLSSYLYTNASTGSGNMVFYNGTGNITAAIVGGGYNTGGEFHLRNDGGTETVRIYGDESNAGGAYFYYSDGTTIGIELDVVGNSSEAEISLYNSAGIETVQISADEAGDGGDISLRNAAGVQTCQLDADYAGTGESRLRVDVVQILGGADLSEQFDVQPAAAAEVKPGMVASIDPDNVGKLVISTTAYDRRVAGIVSGAGEVKPGLLMGQKGSIADGQHPIALTGRVWVYCDASAGAIRPGDLLTTSDVPGHAMKVTDHQKAQGAIIGKAMSSLESGRGLVLVLVSLQ